MSSRPSSRAPSIEEPMFGERMLNDRDDEPDSASRAQAPLSVSAGERYRASPARLSTPVLSGDAAKSPPLGAPWDTSSIEHSSTARMQGVTTKTASTPRPMR